MYSYPFGKMDQIAPSGITVQFSPTLQEINTWNYICCGLTMRRPGFAKNDDATNNCIEMGDVKYCKLLLAALFVFSWILNGETWEL
jgi:hypothetical protein